MGFFDFLSQASPAGAVATVGERVVASVVDGADKLIRDFKLPPEALIEWNKYKLQVVNEAARINMEDRNSARQREIAVKDHVPAILAYMTVGGFLAVMGAELYAFIMMPDEVSKIGTAAWAVIGNISGYLASEAKLVGAYYFGSSNEAPTAPVNPTKS